MNKTGFKMKDPPELAALPTIYADAENNGKMRGIFFLHFYIVIHYYIYIKQTGN